MKRYTLLAVFLVTAMLLVVGTVMAADPIPGWAAMRDSMEMAKGALKQTVGSTVLNTYIPDYGVVFVFEIQYGASLEQIQNNLEKVLRYLVPTIEQLQDDQKIALVGSTGTFATHAWEIIYVATKRSSADLSTWQVYYNAD